MKTALLITTYNWTSALKLLLQSIENLETKPDELIVADDGSGVKTRAIINDFIQKGIVPTKHIWHEDQGFRRSKILNKAIAATDADYIIQTDGDCILHPYFVADHIRNSKAGQYLHGSRTNISKERTKEILESASVNLSLWSRGLKKRFRALHIPLLARYYKPKNHLSSKVRGCNLSYWRRDFLTVNGYNEDIEGWGKEDSELVLRFLNNGMCGKRLKFSGIIFHLWHKENDKCMLKENKLLEAKTREQKIICTSNGIDKYL